MEWLIGQAQTASPFIAVFMMVVGGSAVLVLWKQHQKDQQRLESITAQGNRAMTAAAKALTKLATKIEATKRGQQ